MQLFSYLSKFVIAFYHFIVYIIAMMERPSHFITAVQTQGATNMKNVTITQTANLLTITVDLSKNLGRSKTGKSTIVASTEGNVPLEDGKTFLGVNVYRKA